jgi:hypothetical protein
MDPTRAIIRRMLTETLNYLDIGHQTSLMGRIDPVQPSDAWVLPKGKDDIQYASAQQEDPDEFHMIASRDRLDMKGRIDHEKKMISVLPNWLMSRVGERVDYATSLLKMDYPGYAIYLFRDGRAKRLNEAPERYGYHVTQPHALAQIEAEGLLSPSPEPDEQEPETHFVDELEWAKEFVISPSDVILKFPFPEDAQPADEHWTTQTVIPWEQIEVIRI